MAKNRSRKVRRAIQKGGAFNPDGQVYFNCFIQTRQGAYLPTPSNPQISFPENSSVAEIMDTIARTDFGRLQSGGFIAKKFVFLMKASPDPPTNPHGICQFISRGSSPRSNNFITMRSNGAGGIDIINQRNPPLNWFQPGGSSITISRADEDTLVEQRVPSREEEAAAAEAARANEFRRQRAANDAARRQREEDRRQATASEEEAARLRRIANAAAAEAEAAGERRRLANEEAASAAAEEQRQRNANLERGIGFNVTGRRIENGTIMARLRLTTASGDECLTTWEQFREVIRQCRAASPAIPVPPANSIELYKASVSAEGVFRIPMTNEGGPFMFSLYPGWEGEALTRLDLEPQVLFAGLQRLGASIRPESVLRQIRRYESGI